MEAIKTTRNMIMQLNRKLEEEAADLSEAFRTMDFSLLEKATRQLNLYGQRGYDLITTGNVYAHFKQKSREEFLSLIQQEFKDHGIDFDLPDKAYGGQAIYFRAFGERIGVLYGEDNKVRTEFGKDNLAYMHYVLNGYRDQMNGIQENLRDLDKRKDVFVRVLNDSSIVLKEEFSDERKATLEIKTKGYRFNNQTLQRILDKYFGKLIDRQIGLKLKRDVEKPENQKQFQDHIHFLDTERERELQRIEGIEERIGQLKAHEPDFESVVESFQRLMNKYNISFEGKK